MEIDMTPRLAKKVYEADGGSYSAWCPNELPMLKQANIGAAKISLNKYGFVLPSYSDSAKVAYVLQEGLCWTRTAERQTSRMRIEYLRSVLRQEVGFFDNQDASSTTFNVVSTMSSDAHLIQDVIAEKIPNCLAQLTAFVSGILVAFILSWRLALACLPFAIGFVIPCVGFGKVMMDLVMKGREAYGVAGGIAEQAISSIRTVYSYVGEHQTLDRFSDELQKSTDIGIRQGLAKELLIGSMGMVFVAWA